MPAITSRKTSHGPQKSITTAPSEMTNATGIEGEGLSELSRASAAVAESTDAVVRAACPESAATRRVAAGQLKAGDEIPSVRELAQALAVHPMTISKAYSMLEMEGVLERRRGLSMVVAAQHQHDPAARADASDADDLASEVREAELLEQLAQVRL